MKLNIQLFGGRGTSSSRAGGKTYTKGNQRFKVTKNERGLYDYQSQEKVNGKWVNMSKQKNFTRSAINDWLDISVDF
jgi:hypothetical protein